LVLSFYLMALELPEFKYAKEALLAFRQIFDVVNIVYYILISYGLLCLAFYRR
jgi:hypothetical protein